MNWFLKYIISQERTMMMVLVSLLIMGILACWRIPKEANPDIQYPRIFVGVSLPGISPEDAERLIVKPLEKRLKSISGVKDLRGFAQEGYGHVTLDFEANFNAEKALQAVKDRVDLVKGDLPPRARAPYVHEYKNLSEPVLSVGLSGDLPERELLHLSHELRDEIRSLPQVFDVDISGERSEMVEIIINPEKLQTYHLTPSEVSQRIKDNNQLISAGTWDVGSGRFSFKVKGLLETWETLGQIPIKAVGDKVIILEDVATVVNTFEDPWSFARLGGKRAMVLDVKKRPGENIIATIDAVKKIVKSKIEDWPKSVKVEFFGDNSSHIRVRLGELQNNLISAIILVMVVTITALGVRSGILIGVAIPGSFLLGILFLYLTGMAVSGMVLFSLILASGMLVDGAIIVIEYADRKIGEGVPKNKAYVLATQQMATPVISSILTTIAAFLPLLVWPGITGKYMRLLPLTMVATLTASIFMALIFIPVLGILFGRKAPVNNRHIKQASSLEEGSLENLKGFTSRYVNILKNLIERPGRVLLFAAFFLVGIYLLNIFFGKGIDFFPNIEDDKIEFSLRMRGDLSIWEMDKLLKQVEEKLLDMKELAMIYSRVSTGIDDRRGRISAELIDWKKRRKVDEIIRDIKQRTQGISGVIVEGKGSRHGPVSGKPIRIQLLSDFPEPLTSTVAKISDHLKAMQGLTDVDDSRPIGGIEWKIEIDRKEANKFGLNAQSIGEIVQLVTDGLKVADYMPDDSEEEVEIRLRYPSKDRNLLAIEHLRIPSATSSIPLSNFVHYSPVPAVNKIERLNGKRVMEIEANVIPGALVADKVKEIQQWLATEANIDPKVRLEFKGEDEGQRESQAFLFTAFLVALGLIAIILVAQFNSFYYPFLILTGIIFSTVGVILGVLITRQPFYIIMNGIGIIALAGIIVNNNIVLIDTFLKIRETGIPVKEAILRTCAQRVRPVILTVITATLGVLPMVCAVDFNFISREITYNAPSAQLWRALSTSIAFGLLFGTVLTLVLTPCMLMFGDNVVQWFKKRFSRHGTKTVSG